MPKEPLKTPPEKPVPVDDPLAVLIDKLSDEVEPIDAPPEEDANGVGSKPSDPNTGEPENTA